MAKDDYIPTRDNDFQNWHDQYQAGVTALATTFGLTPADTAAVANDNADFHTKLANAIQTANAAKEATKDKKASRTRIERSIRALTRRIKAHPAYTTALGVQLGVEGPETANDLSNSQPQLWLVDHGGGKVEVQFTKSGSDGVNLYSQRDGETDFVFLTRNTNSPYLDKRPLLAAGKPEVRRYKAIFLEGDAEIGGWSDIVTIACRP